MNRPGRWGRLIGLLVIGLGPGGLALAEAIPSLSLDALRQAPASVVPADASEAEAARDVKVVRDWTGALCRSRVVNEGKTPLRIREVVLFDVPHAYSPETHLYGEGFTMLSQTTGTLGKPVDMGLTDRTDPSTIMLAKLTIELAKQDGRRIAGVGESIVGTR